MAAAIPFRVVKLHDTAFFIKRPRLLRLSESDYKWEVRLSVSGPTVSKDFHSASFEHCRRSGYCA